MRRMVPVLLVLVAAATPATARADAQTERAVRALESSSSLKVRSQAALVLGQLRAVEAAPALRRAAASDAAPAVRIAAVAALSKLGEAEARSTLESVARADPDESVRAAATAALADLSGPAASPRSPGAARGSTAVSLEEAVGAGGSPAERAALRDAIDRRLREAGFQVQGSGGIRLKPSIIRLDVERAGEKTVVAIRAELVAVEGGGRMAAMLEGGARLSAAGKLGEPELAAVSVRAVDAVAKVLVDDLAAKLGER